MRLDSRPTRLNECSFLLRRETEYRLHHQTKNERTTTMNYFWIIIGLIEILAVGLLLFGLLTACVARWRKRTPAIAVLGLFVLCVVGPAVLLAALGHKVMYVIGTHYLVLKHLLIAAIVAHCIGYLTVTRFGWRRRDPEAAPAAATWPRARLLVASLVALVLSLVTHWNITLSVQQRLARVELEARVMALSVMPGRPIDSLNAAILYEPVFERLAERDHKANPVPDRWLDFDKPMDTEDPELRSLLENHRPDLDALVRASALPQCYFGIQQPRDFFIGGGHFDWIGQAHGAGRLLAVDTRAKIAGGDLEGATRRIPALFRMAAHIDQTPTLITALVSRAIDRWAVDCVQALLNHPELSAELLSTLQLEARSDYRRSLKRALAFEESGATSLVTLVSTGGFYPLLAEDAERSKDDERSEDGGGALGGALGIFLWATMNPYFIEHELSAFRSIHQQYRELLNLPWPEASVQVEQLSKNIWRGGALTAMMMPEFYGAIVHVMIGDARHRQARLAVAMRRYELERGALPERFGDLVPAYLQEVPLDPSTEQPFMIENVDGGVRLYSGGIEAMDRREGADEEQVKVEMFLESRPAVE